MKIASAFSTLDNVRNHGLASDRRGDPALDLKSNVAQTIVSFGIALKS